MLSVHVPQPCVVHQMEMRELQQMQQQFWTEAIKVTDIQYKQFLNENTVWYKKYYPIVQDTIAKYRAAGKAVPSLALVMAVIKQESNGEGWAVRYEPTFHKWLEGRLNGPPKVFGGAISKATELINRSSSFGPGQVMGQTAREHGFTGQYLTELCDPKVGIDYAVKVLCSLMARYDGDEKAVMAAYNAGSAKKLDSGKYANQEYVDSVSRFKLMFDHIVSKGW